MRGERGNRRRCGGKSCLLEVGCCRTVAGKAVPPAVRIFTGGVSTIYAGESVKVEVAVFHMLLEVLETCGGFTIPPQAFHLLVRELVLRRKQVMPVRPTRQGDVLPPHLVGYVRLGAVFPLAPEVDVWWHNLLVFSWVTAWVEGLVTRLIANRRLGGRRVCCRAIRGAR